MLRRVSQNVYFQSPESSSDIRNSRVGTIHLDEATFNAAKLRNVGSGKYRETHVFLRVGSELLSRQDSILFIDFC